MQHQRVYDEIERDLEAIERWCAFQRRIVHDVRGCTFDLEDAEDETMINATVRHYRIVRRVYSAIPREDHEHSLFYDPRF